jgi:predicted dehydrogenase
VNFDWCFNIHLLQRSRFRLDPRNGGGALYDVGIYGVDFIRFLTGSAVDVIDATMIFDDPGGVDMMTHVLLTSGGVLTAMTVGYTCDANSYTISGEKGSLHVPGSVSGRVVDNVLHMHILGGDRRGEERFEAENPYTAEMEYFGQCIAENRAPEPGIGNAMQNLRVIEKINATARRVTALSPQPAGPG